MKKYISLLVLGLAIILAGCEEEVPLAAIPVETNPTVETTTCAAEEVTEPEGTGVYFIKDLTYLDGNDKQLMRMTTTLNDKKLPKTVVTDSGKDLVHTIFYDDQGQITGFQQSEYLYGEAAVSIFKVNDRGDVIQHTTSSGTESESTVSTAYTYNDQGLITKKEQTKNGNFYATEITEYDEHNNITKKESSSVNSSDKSYVYTNTYKDDKLVKTVQSMNDKVVETITYTYDEKGFLIGKNINGSQIYTYSYTDEGLLKELVITKGENTNCCEYNALGQIAVQYNYTNGSLTSKLVYTWEEFETPITQAHIKIYQQLSIVSKLTTGLGQL